MTVNQPYDTEVCILTDLSALTASSHTCIPRDSNTSIHPKYCNIENKNILLHFKQFGAALIHYKCILADQHHEMVKRYFLYHVYCFKWLEKNLRN